MTMPTPRELLEYLSPFVVTAGAYSARVQARVASHEAKAGATPFHHALSDADLTIQAFLEVALLARYPEVSFFSEERDQSLNTKYFAADAELEVLVDPIDGTRAYLDNRPHYQIIVAVHDRESIVGALCYMPRLKRGYMALKGEGAVVYTEGEMVSGGKGVPLQLSQTTGPVLVFNRPDIVKLLEPHFAVVDLLTEYSRGEVGLYPTDLLSGRALAYIAAPCQAIDAGALAMIAREAGAVVTDSHGNPMGSFRGDDQRVLPCIVTAANQEVSDRLVQELGALTSL